MSHSRRHAINWALHAVFVADILMVRTPLSMTCRFVALLPVSTLPFISITTLKIMVPHPLPFNRDAPQAYCLPTEDYHNKITA